MSAYPLKSRQLARTLERLDAHHDASRFDDGVSRFALFELEFVRRLIGDRSSDNLFCDIDSNMRSGSALLHLDDLTFELIARADFHRTSSDLHPGQTAALC